MVTVYDADAAALLPELEDDPVDAVALVADVVDADADVDAGFDAEFDETDEAGA